MRPACVVSSVGFRTRVLYVATGSEVSSDARFAKWVRDVEAETGISVLVKEQLDPRWTSQEYRTLPIGPLSREEGAAIDAAVVRQANWFIGWHQATTFSWLGALGHPTSQYLASCRSVKRKSKYLLHP